MSEADVKFCRDCRHSLAAREYLYCSHPVVNKGNCYALAAVAPLSAVEDYIRCLREREKTGWFDACGIKGKLWEPKP